MSDIETSAETFESILKGILEKGDDDDIGELGSKIKNETLLNKLNLTKENDSFGYDDYKFDENENIQELTDDEKRKIVFVLKDNNGYFENCKEEIDKLFEIIKKTKKIEIYSEINRIITEHENGEDLIIKVYDKLGLAKTTEDTNSSSDKGLNCYEQYKKIEEVIIGNPSELNKLDQNFKDLCTKICGAKLEILKKYEDIDGVKEEIKALKSLEESSKMKKIKIPENVKNLFEERIEKKIRD